MRSNFEGPTMGRKPGAGFTPFSPWQSAHFCAYIAAPCLAVPLPDGRPLPSGRTSMFQAAMSLSVIGFPSPGVCAMAVPAPKPHASPKTARMEEKSNLEHVPMKLKHVRVLAARVTSPRRGEVGSRLRDPG